jgi:hypothetical protein
MYTQTAIGSHLAKEAPSALVLTHFAVEHLLGTLRPLVLHHSCEMAICNLQRFVKNEYKSQEKSKSPTQTLSVLTAGLARYFAANKTSAAPLPQ